MHMQHNASSHYGFVTTNYSVVRGLLMLVPPLEAKVSGKYCSANLKKPIGTAEGHSFPYFKEVLDFPPPSIVCASLIQVHALEFFTNQDWVVKEFTGNFLKVVDPLLLSMHQSLRIMALGFLRYLQQLRNWAISLWVSIIQAVVQRSCTVL